MSEFIRIAIRKLLKKDQTLLLNPVIKENLQKAEEWKEMPKLDIQKHSDQISSIQQKEMAQRGSLGKRNHRRITNKE
jgi:Arc/MetJ-type ribon-helix-helix transcriptional regulator